jgi:hypothetical protein
MNQRDYLQQTSGTNQKPIQSSARVASPIAVQRKVAASMARQPPSAPAVYRPQPVPRVLQMKPPTRTEPNRQPMRALVPTPARNPPPQPRVLQRKVTIFDHALTEPTRRTPKAPSVYRPQPTPIVLQLKGARQEKTLTAHPPHQGSHSFGTPHPLGIRTNGVDKFSRKTQELLPQRSASGLPGIREMGSPAQPAGRFGRLVQRKAPTVLQLSSRGGQVSTRNMKGEVVKHACRVLGSSAKKLAFISQSPGGWEIWFQTELYASLLSEMGEIIVREHKGYGNAQRADLMLPCSDGELMVEIKCESFWQKDTFVKAVEADIAKLSAVTDGIMLIVTNNDETAKSLKKIARLVERIDNFSLLTVSF